MQKKDIKGQGQLKDKLSMGQGQQKDKLSIT